MMIYLTKQVSKAGKWKLVSLKLSLIENSFISSLYLKVWWNNKTEKYFGGIIKILVYFWTPKFRNYYELFFNWMSIFLKGDSWYIFWKFKSKYLLLFSVSKVDFKKYWMVSQKNNFLKEIPVSVSLFFTFYNSNK